MGGAGRVQAGNELAVGVIHVAVLVGLQAAQIAQGEGASALGGVEGAVLQGEQALGALEEVGVLAGAGQLVVALDGGLGGLDVHALDHAEQFVDGVGLKAAALFHGRIDIGGGTHVDAQAGSGVLGQRLVAIDAGHAVGGGEVRQLLGPGGVEELVGLALRLQLHLVLQLLAGQVLVHEALAAQVQPEIAVVADDTAAVGAGTAAHVVDHRGVPLLDGGTGPGSHLVALTDIGVVAFVIKVDAQDVDAVFHAFRRVELHHVLVAQVIARGQNDAGRGDLDVAVGAGGLGVDARDGALVIQDQLDALGGVAHLGAGVHGGLQVVGHDGGQAGKADGSGIAGQVLFGVVVGLRHRVHVGEHIVGLGVRRNLGVAFGRHVQVLAGADEPVERGARLVVVAADDALAHVVAALLHVHVHDHLLIEEAVAAAPLGLGLAAEDGHVAGHAVEVRGRLKAHHLRASLGRGAGRRHAGCAQAHHDHVGRQLFFHLIVADCGRLAEPGQRARAVEADGGIGCARGAKRLARAA